MAGIKDVYTDIKAKVEAMGLFQFVHIWNNQLQQLEDGTTYSFPFPCCFIEIIPPTEYNPLGGGYSQGNLVVKFHIGHEEYDTMDGNMEENVNVLSFRDSIIATFTNYQPVACSSMMKSAEVQDYVHTNIYHYMVDFRTAFIDDKGVKSTILVDVNTLTLDVTTTNETDETIYTVQQGKAYSTAVTATTDGQTDFFVLDQNGNQILGANIVNVTKEIKGLRPNQWHWNPSTSHLTLLGGLTCVTGETLFIIYQQNL
jgi:hypothetical protein